jgi:putative membrane protein
MSDLNDPRVFFAAERTLLAWTRSSLTLMAFGFAVERFGLFVRFLGPRYEQVFERQASFWSGIGMIALGAYVAFASILQYRQVLKTLKSVEIPEHYRVNLGVFTNLCISVFGICLIFYLFFGER